MEFVSRAGEKLAFALKEFEIVVKDFVCADLGCSTGGFTDCLLQNGATKVYAVDTGYGVLDWKLRNDNRVVVMERTNAMQVLLPEKMDFVSVDTSWTKQKNILPKAISLIKENGVIVSLIKPHYEADKRHLVKGKLKEEFLKETLEKVKNDLADLHLEILGFIKSPITGKSGKNEEYLAYLKLKK
jgi:23S rRNA (cytidine1920-2'-O)/16S rRNA (cytidine1409-2'-O)-methyltransferase